MDTTLSRPTLKNYGTPEKIAALLQEIQVYFLYILETKITTTISGVIEVDTLMILRDFYEELKDRTLQVERHKGYYEQNPNGPEYAYQQGKQEAYLDIQLLLAYYFDLVLESKNKTAP
jgi:hypothetical protein